MNPDEAPAAQHALIKARMAFIRASPRRHVTIRFMSLKQLNQENNFFYLCIALVGILFSSAVAREFPGTWGQTLFSLVIVAMMLLSVKSLHPPHPWRYLIHGLLLLLVLFSFLSRWWESRVIDSLALGLMMAFFVATFRHAATQIFFVGRVNLNKIVGSLSLYLLLGIVWTLIYLLVLTLDPSALQGVDFDNWRQSFPRVAYYSFVTLTTLGYGDILPTDRLLEFFAYMEATAGVFYLAIVVASLVSIGIQQATQPREKDGSR